VGIVEENGKMKKTIFIFLLSVVASVGALSRQAAAAGVVVL